MPRAGLPFAGFLAAACLLSACGTSSSTANTPPAPVAPACQDDSVSLAVGATLQLDECGPGATAALTAGTALEATGPLRFIAVHAGEAVVDVSSGPVCTPGMVCSQLRIHRATLQVTVR